MRPNEGGAPVKVCSQCGEQKPVAQFSRLHSAKDGRRAYCKECGRKYGTSYRKAHKGKMSAKHAQWRDAHRSHYREYQKQYQRLYRMRVVATQVNIAADTPIQPLTATVPIP